MQTAWDTGLAQSLKVVSLDTDQCLAHFCRIIMGQIQVSSCGGWPILYCLWWRPHDCAARCKWARGAIDEVSRLAAAAATVCCVRVVLTAQLRHWWLSRICGSLCRVFIFFPFPSFFFLRRILFSLLSMVPCSWCSAYGGVGYSADCLTSTWALFPSPLSSEACESETASMQGFMCVYWISKKLYQTFFLSEVILCWFQWKKTFFLF